MPDGELRSAIAGGAHNRPLRARIFEKNFGTVTAWGRLEHAIRALMLAAETGKREDVAKATDLIERACGERGS